MRLSRPCQYLEFGHGLPDDDCKSDADVSRRLPRLYVEDIDKMEYQDVTFHSQASSSNLSPQERVGVAAKGKRNRSFGGCTACRSRRVKCDETHPVCVKCIQAGLTCGYESSLFFDSDNGQQGASSRFRRPILTIEERQCMSVQLTESIPPSLTTWVLEQIDEQCEGLALSAQVGLQHGPFGVFRRGKERQVAAQAVPPAQQYSHQAADFSPQNQLCSADQVWSPNTEQILNYLFDDHGRQLSPGIWDFPAVSPGISNDCRVQELADDTSLPDFNTNAMVPSFPSDPASLDNAISNIAADQFNISPSLSPVQFGLIDISQSAWILLKHYLGSVLKSLTPFRHSKTPWHILFIPLVKNTLAGLALQEDLDEASLCVFYGILAISALSLGGTTNAPSWTRKSELYRQKAYGHAQASLQTAYATPKKAKYKTQLMALLTMAQMAIVSGNSDETEYFLLESEKLIRIRGLRRQKSRKVRLLHHCYAYERIFFESTSSSNGKSRHQDLRAAIESGGAANSSDSVTFSLPNLADFENEMLKIKGQESGENDLHLQLPGIWPAEQYSEIFGLPESYVYLVSLIVRLARERDGELNDNMTSSLSVKDYAAQAKVIEGLIKQQLSARPYRDQDLRHLMDATHQAVNIYFYRRIYNMDAGMLQQHVADVRDSLLGFERASAEKGFATTRLIWAAFVAACEAETPQLRSFFVQWFERASQESGLRVFASTMADVERVWTQRQNQPVTNVAYLNALPGNH